MLQAHFSFPSRNISRHSDTSWGDMNAKQNATPWWEMRGPHYAFKSTLCESVSLRCLAGSDCLIYLNCISTLFFQFGRVCCEHLSSHDLFLQSFYLEGRRIILPLSLLSFKMKPLWRLFYFLSFTVAELMGIGKYLYYFGTLSFFLGLL